MRAPTFTYQRGEPIIVDVVVNDAGDYDPSSLTVAMALKAAVNGRVPPRTAEIVKNFTVSYVAASGSDPAYWRGTIAAADTALLSDMYAADAEISASGTVIEVTSPVMVFIAESVTPE